MAPGNKKKKKAAANPARGFATVSQVSKKTIEIEAVAKAAQSLPEDEKNQNPSAPDTVAPQTEARDPDPKTAELKAADLSPEEFERALEDAELQQWVDKHSTSFRKDAVRQVTRLQTDRRILREQAQYLNTKSWLPPDLVSSVLELISLESKSGLVTADSDNLPKPRPISEEAMTVRLWTLRQTLLDLGFQPDHIEQVLRYILDCKPQPTKENIWGLNESLDWLALHSERADLPDYERRHPRTVG